MHNALMNKICTSNIQLKHWANVILICYLGCTSERKSKRINTSLFFRVPFNDFESIMNTLILSYQDASFYFCICLCGIWKQAYILFQSLMYWKKNESYEVNFQAIELHYQIMFNKSYYLQIFCYVSLIKFIFFCD